MWVGLIQSVKVVAQIEQLSFLQVTGNSSCLTSLIWDISFFLTWMTAIPLALLVLRPLVWNFLVSSGSLPTEDLGILSLH